MGIGFWFNSILLGVGLAADAFSVSLADGLKEPQMKKRKALLISAVFGLFQGLMPLLGWALVHTVVEKFEAFGKAIPWIALALLGFIGGKMIFEAVRGENGEEAAFSRNFFLTLLLQGVATSIDALSVGFTIAEYTFGPACVCAAVIALITFGLCFIGVLLGKKFASKLAGKATFVGGVILIVIGIEIFLKGIL